MSEEEKTCWKPGRKFHLGDRVGPERKRRADAKEPVVL